MMVDVMGDSCSDEIEIEAETGVVGSVRDRVLTSDIHMTFCREVRRR